jgi:hypothetical protein
MDVVYRRAAGDRFGLPGWAWMAKPWFGVRDELRVVGDDNGATSNLFDVGGVNRSARFMSSLNNPQGKRI